MNAVGGSAAVTPAEGVTPAEREDARLRKACQQLEGVFMEELARLMRETVPRDGLFDGGSGEDMFTTLLDRHTSDEAAARLERGIGAALYERLRQRVGGLEPVDAGPAAAAGVAE